MISKIKKPVSILLALMMVVSLFAIVPITASAAEETSTVTWGNNNLNNGGTGGMSSGGVTLTTQQAKTRVGDCFYSGRGSATFTAPEGSVFTKIELKNATVVNSLNFPSATVAQTGGYSKQDPWDDEPEWVPYYTVTWTGESSEVTFSGAIYAIQSIVFTLKSVAPTTYTVTWKNGDTTLKTDTFDKDTVPDYSGNLPTKAEDAQYSYTFTGWTDSSNTFYSKDSNLPAVTKDETYTATFASEDKAVKNVITLINALPTDVTAADKAQIEAARAAYNMLTDDQKAKVSDETLEKLTAAETALAAAQKEEADTTAANTVATAINALPASNAVTTADKDAIEAARAAYDALTDDQKAKVDTDTLKKLTDAEEALAKATADKAAADAVTAKINALPAAAEITAADKAKIESARAAYNTLTDAQKAYVDDATMQKLTAAETALAAAEKLFAGHSVTLGGNIGVNFFINSKTADFASDENAYVKFTWDNGTYNKEVKLKDLTTDADGYYKATVDVVAAQMAHKIHAEVYLNGEKLDQTDDYSVQDYAETVFKNPTAYDDKGKPNELKALAKALLNYGAMAQIVFDGYLVEKPALANKTVGDNGYEGVTADQIEGAINGEASDLDAAAAAFDAEFYTSSLIYLSRNTLRLYFTPASKTVGALNGLDFSGNLSEYYYFKDVENIPAAELDNLQEFKVGSTTFYFSALDYAKAVVESTKMKPEQQNLAKALYLYNKAANAYFDDAPAPVENVVDLSTLTGAYEAKDGDVLSGILSGDKKITIADGATITLRDANITLSTNAQYAGITPVGDATILLEGKNTVKGGYENFPGVFVPVGKTLTIDGTGSLTASSGGNEDRKYSCGIGGGYEIAAGNIVINGGTITANGGDWAAGIGSGYEATCGNILIAGGTVTATGGESAAGIGSGLDSTCGNITIAGTVTQVTATKGEGAEASIGAGESGTCGTVTIEDNSKVTQN